MIRGYRWTGWLRLCAHIPSASFTCVHLKAERDDYSPQSVDLYLRQKYGLECEFSNCVCMRINTRNRLAAKPSKKILNLKANELVVCAVHCALVRAIDTGYALTEEEARKLAHSKFVTEIEQSKS